MGSDNQYMDQMRAMGELPYVTRLEQRIAWLKEENAQLKDRLAESDRAYYDAAGTIAHLKAELAEATKHASWPVSICVGCGATTGFKNIVYDTPGEPVDYDMECTTCGSREIDEGRASRLVERCERAEAKLEAYEAIPQDKDGTPFAAASAWRAECNRIKEQLEEHKQREARLREALARIANHGPMMLARGEYRRGQMDMLGGIARIAKQALEEAGT